MIKKTSVYFTNEMQEFVKFRSKKTNWSGAVKEWHRELSHLVAQQVDMTEGEMQLLYKMYARQDLFHLTFPINIVRDIMIDFDAMELSELDESHRKLAEKLRGMSQAEQYVIIDKVRKNNAKTLKN